MHFKSFKKIASIIILTVFIANNSIYAAPDSKSIFKNKKVNYQKISDKNEGVMQQKKTVLTGQDAKEAESQKKEARKMLSAHLSDISLIHIPQELGKVVEVYQNPGRDNSRLIVNIQDLHTNPEATINLAGILEILIKDYNLGLVCSEGAEGAVDTSSVSSFPDPEVRKKVARLFVDSGELTGEEYLSITKYPNLAIWGIEDKDIYFKNIEEFNSIMKFNPDSRTFISQAKKALEGLKPRIYSKELLEIDRKESDYESQAVETADHLKYLSSYGQKLNIPTISYKNISLLDETMDKESKIDQQKITQESQNLLLNLQSAIAAKSNRSDMDTLMAKASLFKDQKISPFSFYSYLKDLADKYLKDQISKYPNLMDFIDYLTKVNSLDSIKLFVEIEDLSYEIKQKLARNEEEKMLTQALRNIKFLEGFFNLKISNEELDYYLQNKDSCKVAFFETFLKPAIKKYNLSDFVDFNPGLIDPHLQEIEDFYKTVKARDLAMFTNTVFEVEKRNIKVATLITGGFHTQGVTKLLKEKGYSYIVISPYSKTDIDEENYHFLLSGKRKPIEDLIKQLDQPEAINKVSANTNLRVPMTFDRGSSVERVEKTLERAAASGNAPVHNETFETAISESLDQYAAIHGADKRNHGLDLSMERLGIDNIRILLDDSVLSEKQKSLVRKLLAFGKGSVFSFWGELDVEQKKNLLNQLAMVDLEGIESLYKAFIIDKKEGTDIEVTENNVTMPKVVDITDTNGPGYAKADKAGEGAFKNGEVCYLELAGGSGSRLGYEHAKIIFKASQVMNMSLAKMRAKKIRALAEEYGKPVPWLIMTSDVTDREVREFFKNNIVNNKYFEEVPVQWVRFVRQRVMPQITDTGEFILNQAKDSVIVGGFGHGDARDYVLKDQGVLNWLTKDFRVKYVVMLNVDNAYVPGAPSVGYHIIATENLAPGTEKMSVHSVEKTGPGERVGMNVLFNGRSAVIEYNQVPDKLLYMTYIYVFDNDKIVFLKEHGNYRILKVSQLKDKYRDVFQDPGWVRSNLVTVNDLPKDVSIDYLGRQYVKDMLVRARLWLLLGNTNGLIWSMDSFTDQRYPLPELPVVVAKNKAVDGYHPETGEFFTKGDGALKASKFECMAFQGFYHNPVMGAFILVPRPGYFAPIKEARGQDTPERARQIFAEYDASLLNNVNWMVATDATVELTPAFAFLDGRYLTHRMGQGGVIGRGSKLHLSGSNVHIGDMFNMGKGKTFILRFNDEHNKKAGAQIGNNIEVQGDISITISGSGNLIIDDDVRITGFQEYTIKSNETLRITKNGPVWKTRKADQVLASNKGMDRFAQWDKWISMSVSIGDLNDDMFRDYDYRSIGKTLAPEMVFRFGLVWANMALEKAKANGFTNRKVLIARDARKIEPELVEALVAALRFAGLDVIYVAADGPNAVTSYSWAAQEHKPLMSIFLTASHVSRPKEIIVRGFKVAIMDESGTLQSLTTKEIMQTSKAAVKDLIVNPVKINTIKSMRQGEFMPSNVDANCVKMCVLVGKTVASGNSIYNLARELGASESPVTVLDDWDRRIGHLEPLKGMKMIVEGAHTPSGKLAADTFIGLGAEVILINGDIQEIEGEHEADPSIPKNLTGLERAIAAHNADFGIAFDLDGDRGAIVVPERWKATVGTKFHLLAPDNLIVSMLTYMIRRGGYDQAVIGREVGVIRDVLGTFAVNDMASRLGIKAFQTDAGYVFLKALRRQLLPRGYIVPVYGERSGHCWLDVTGEFENPIAVAVLFATMIKESKYKDNATQSKNPFLEAYEENIIPYLQSTRFQPLFHPKLLSELSSDLRNNTGWTYNAERPTNPPQAIIALGKDLGIQKLQQEFKVGNLYLTPDGNLRIKEFNTYQDVPDEGGLYRFADIVFEQDGKFAGRFVFRASSNDPTFVCSFETPLMDGETYISASLDNRYLSIGGVVLDWLESNGIAGVTGDIKYPNKDATELVVTKYRAKLASVRGDAGRGSVFGLLNTMARLGVKAGDAITVFAIQDERRKGGGRTWSESSVRREFTDAESLGIIRRAGTKDERGREIFEVLASFTSDQLEALPANVKIMLDRGRIKEEEAGEMRTVVNNVKEKQGAAVVAVKLATPLNANGNSSMAASFLRGGYGQEGYGVPEEASIHGSFALDGNQGYYAEGGKEVFLSTVNSMREFFERRAERLGKPIKYVIKTGIGGQHTPFQGIADAFQVIDARTGKVVGEYELGKNFEVSMASVLRDLKADWDQVAVIPSSKSGSTDETMMVFVEIFYTLLKNQAIKEGIDGSRFADTVLATLHEVNFINGKEQPGKDLFRVDMDRFKTDNLITLIAKNAESLGISRAQIKGIFGRVLGNMFFETTDRVDQSRLSAFIRNSGLDTELGEDAPGFGAMFDNVGGRWTGDLHMMTFLAYHGLDAEKYWEIRREGIARFKEGNHIANIIGNKILDEGITDIALVVPDEFFWFGKSNEQNFNESIWQNGFANLIAIRQSQWGAQKKHYADDPKKLVINMSNLLISADLFNVFKFDTPDFSKLDNQGLANAFAELFTTFYGITTIVGDRLIDRALKEAGYTADDVDLNDVNNPAAKIVQQNLYVRQPYVEFGKGFLEARLKALQEREAANPGAINKAFEGTEEENEGKKSIKQLAREGTLETNIEGLNLPSNIANLNELADVIREASEFAKTKGRKFVPLIYLEGDRFYNLRDYLIYAGIEWVMQGTGDQHISYQQVLAQPQKYLPFIISFVPEKPLPGKPAIGFAKGYLNNVSPYMVRDLFADASYRALTESRKDQGGLGLFLRIIDSDANIDMLKQAARIAAKSPGDVDSFGEAVLLANAMGAERTQAIAALQNGDELLKIAREPREHIPGRKEKTEAMFKYYRGAMVAYQKALNIIEGKNGLKDIETQAEAGIGRVTNEVKNKIIAIAAVNILHKIGDGNGKEWFREWIARQPDNVAVVIIAANIEEYKEVTDLQDVAYLQLVALPADLANSDISKAGIQDYQILKLNTEERNAFFFNLEVYKEGVNLGTRHLLDEKAVRAIASGV